MVKADLTTSFGSLSGTAIGIPLTLDMVMVDAATGRPLPGTAVYTWHCTADGRYSIYEIDDQNFLRGVVVADDSGLVRYQTIYPGCYRGRWPHTHFEVFPSLDDASAGSSATKTSQLAFPAGPSEVVYEDGRYGDSAACLDELSIDFDVVFEDGAVDQLVEVSGSPADGFVGTVLVRV